MYAERIKKIRETLDLSARKLSEKIDIPERTIVSYEGGRIPSMEFLAQLCKIYNVNANWFVTGEGEMFNASKFEQVESELAQRMDKMEAALKSAGILKD